MERTAGTEGPEAEWRRSGGGVIEALKAGGDARFNTRTGAAGSSGDQRITCGTHMPNINRRKRSHDAEAGVLQQQEITLTSEDPKLGKITRSGSFDMLVTVRETRNLASVAHPPTQSPVAGRLQNRNRPAGLPRGGSRDHTNASPSTATSICIAAMSMAEMLGLARYSVVRQVETCVLSAGDLGLFPGRRIKEIKL